MPIYKILDPVTNRVVSEEMLIFLGKPKHSYDHGFVKIFTVFFDSIIENKEVCGKAIRLLLYIMNEIDFNTLKFVLAQNEIAKKLNVSKMTVCRWVKALETAQIIERVEHQIYRVKPYQFVRGSMNKAIKKEYRKKIEKSIEEQKKFKQRKLKVL